MRAIYWRELREFGVVGTSLVVAGASTGVALWMEHHPWMAILGTATSIGVVVGVFHGLHDRFRRGDLFLRHRPIAPWRIEIGRTLAGATVCLASVLAMVNVLMLPWRARSFTSTGHGPLTGELTLLCLTGALALWAATRFGVSRRRPGVAVLSTALILPGVGSALAMLPGPALGVLGAVLTTALFAALSVLDLSGLAERTVPRRVSALAVALIACVVGLEGGAWIRASGLEVRRSFLDTPGMTADGQIVRMSRGGRGGLVDANGRCLPPSLTPSLTTVQWAPLYQIARADPRPDAFEHDDALPVIFGASGAAEREGPDRVCHVLATSWGQMSPWRFEDGRFAMDDMQGVIVGTIGPDGWVPGAAAAAAPRFAEPRLIRLSRSWVRAAAGGPSQGGHVLVIADDGLGEVIVAPLPSAGFWTAKPATGTPSEVEPARRVRVGAPGAVTIERPPLMRGDELWVNHGNEPPIALRTDNELIVISGQGELLGRTPLDRDRETILGAQGGTRGMSGSPSVPTGEPLATLVSSIVGSYDPARIVVRLRQFQAASDPIVGELTLTANTVEKQMGGLLDGASALTTPPLLAVLASGSPPPRDLYTRQRAWLLNPVLMVRSGRPWLALSLLLGLLCGGAAWLRARRRTSRAMLLIGVGAALALGPAGLIAVFVAVPAVAVEACACGRSRSVADAVCGACGAAWPLPATRDTEIILDVNGLPETAAAPAESVRAS